MKINSTRRPWDTRTKSQGHRFNPDAFYHSALWKRTRAAFILGRTWLRDGATGMMVWLSNTFCHTCFERDGKLEKMHTVDHKKQIIEGGSRTDHANLQSMCPRCHAQKSAREANAKRLKTKTI